MGILNAIGVVYSTNKKGNKPDSEQVKLRADSIDAVNEKFREALAKREEKRMLGMAALVIPEKKKGIAIIEAARERRNAPVIKTELDPVTGLVIQELVNGIKQVHVPAGVGDDKYHKLIGMNLFPEKYKTHQEIKEVWDRKKEKYLPRLCTLLTRLKYSQKITTRLRIHKIKTRRESVLV